MTTAKVRVRGVFWRDSRKGTQITPDQGTRRMVHPLHRSAWEPAQGAGGTPDSRDRALPEAEDGGPGGAVASPSRSAWSFDEIVEDFLAYSRAHKQWPRNASAWDRKPKLVVAVWHIVWASSRLPGAAIPEDGIEDRQELSHGGRQL